MCSTFCQGAPRLHHATEDPWKRVFPSVSYNISLKSLEGFSEVRSSSYCFSALIHEGPDHSPFSCFLSTYIYLNSSQRAFTHTLVPRSLLPVPPLHPWNSLRQSAQSFLPCASLRHVWGLCSRITMSSVFSLGIFPKSCSHPIFNFDHAELQIDAFMMIYRVSQIIRSSL